MLRRETYGDTVLDFFYDANGTPYSMLQNRGAMYYYITNLQGDVIRLVNSSGQTAAYYEYDPYGNAITAAGSHCEINPLRYRGYVYDTETGLYYCQSRYYDPEIGRFINGDSFASTGQGIIGYNMFAYCNNSPTNGADATGQAMAMSEKDLFAGGGVGTVSIPTILPFIPFLFSIKEEEKEEVQAIATVQETKSYQYWSASRVKKAVLVGRGLSFSEARLRVACGFDVMCINHDAARALIIANRYRNAVGPEIHGDSGYYWHYHPNRNTHTHIWYY